MKFLRRIWSRHSKLGKKRKKKQVWRRPKGRDNKMREKRRGYPATVSQGYRKKRNERGKIKDKIPKIVNNLRDLEKIKNENVVIIGKVGRKKKIEIVKKAKEMKLQIYNLKIKKLLKKTEKNKK